VTDPYLEELMQMGGQALQPHQAAVIEAAAARVAAILADDYTRADDYTGAELQSAATRSTSVCGSTGFTM
jgi:hypothetical protein